MYGESIYALIPKEYVPPAQKLRYRSRHDPQNAPTGSTFINHTTSRQVSNLGGQMRTTMGPHTHMGRRSTFGRVRGSYRPNRTEYRRKYTGSMGGTGIKKQLKRTNALPSQKKLKNFRCPPIVTRGEKPIMGLKSNKNFIIANAVENILQPAKTLPSKRRYIQKKNFGKVPKYLQEIKKNISEEYNTIRQMAKQQEEHSFKERYVMPDQELQNLIKGLKKKWDQVYHEFQKEAHVKFIDTVGKRDRRLGCEAKLKQIERDIQALTFQQVYVDTRK